MQIDATRSGRDVDEGRLGERVEHLVGLAFAAPHGLEEGADLFSLHGGE